MVGHGGSSAGSYLANPTSPIPSHCVSIVATSTLRVNVDSYIMHLYEVAYYGFTEAEKYKWQTFQHSVCILLNSITL